MKSILKISFLLLFSVLGTLTYAQSNNNSKSVIAKEHLMRINAHLPNDLQINENGKVNQSFSRGQTHLLDSTHFYNWKSSVSNWEMIKRTYNTSYDIDGNSLEVLSYELDNLGNFILSGKTNYVISNNRVAAFYNFSWNGSNWDSIAVGTYRYNSNNYITHYEDYSIDVTTLQRTPGFRYDYTYNSNNSFLSQTLYNNNVATNTWKPSQQTLFTYDNNNNQVEILGNRPDANTGQLVTNRKDSIFYNSNGHRNLILKYFINTANNSWDLTFQELFVTNSAGYDIERLIQQKNAVSQSWVNQYRFTTTYNANNKRIFNQSENWNNNISDWEITYKEETAYTSFGELSSTNIYSTGVTGTLQHVLELTYLYDNDNQLIRVEEKGYDAAVGTLLNSKARDEFRSLHNTTNTKEYLAIEGIKSYPNPTKGNVFIEIPTNLKKLNIEVWNTQGVLLERQERNSNQFTVDLSAYPNGLYFIKINHEAYNQTVIKVVKD